MTKKAYITVRDEVFCQISGLEPPDMRMLDERFAVMVEGAFFMPLYKMGRWDGKVHFFDKAGKIYFRLLDEIVPFLECWNYEIELKDERRPVGLIDTRMDEEWFLRKPEHTLGVKLRPYQVEAVNCALSSSSGFMVAGTGAGKTLICAALADVMTTHGFRTIVIVPGSDLVTQTVGTFKLCNIDVGTYSGASKDISHDVVVATWQALQNNPAIVENFQCMIVDEAHGATARVIGDLINVHGKHIAYRYGCTGTMPKPKIDQLTLRGAIGEVVFEITAAELIAQGYLSELEIEPVEIQETAGEEFPDYGAERNYINRNPDRLDFIADLVISRAEQYGNTLVLVNSIKQGKALQKLIKNSVFLEGATENEVRAEWYHMFENEDGLIVIATFGIASQGISIDRIFNFMMIDAGKGFVRCIQSIGRSLRKGRDKDRVHCVDVHSSLKWAKKHFRERKKWYTEALYPVLKTSKAKL
jgi:superfamily II DNA or RNA helicase